MATVGAEIDQETVENQVSQYDASGNSGLLAYNVSILIFKQVNRRSLAQRRRRERERALRIQETDENGMPILGEVNILNGASNQATNGHVATVSFAAIMYIEVDH